MKHIILNNQVTINNTVGHRVGGNCKLALNRTTGDVFKSGADLAENLGVSKAYAYQCCRESKNCNQNEVRFASHTSEDIEWMAERIRELVQENASMRADAERGRAIREAEEAEQKAEELRQIAIAKATERVERRERIAEKAYNDYLVKAERLRNAKNELAALFGTETIN